MVLGENSKKPSKGIDCWLNKPSRRSPVSAVGSTAKEREFVLDPKPPPLSLGTLIIKVKVIPLLYTSSYYIHIRS